MGGVTLNCFVEEVQCTVRAKTLAYMIAEPGSEEARL